MGHLTRIRIKPEKGLGIQRLHLASADSFPRGTRVPGRGSGGFVIPQTSGLMKPGEGFAQALGKEREREESRMAYAIDNPCSSE